MGQGGKKVERAEERRGEKLSVHLIYVRL